VPASGLLAHACSRPLFNFLEVYNPEEETLEAYF